MSLQQANRYEASEFTLLLGIAEAYTGPVDKRDIDKLLSIAPGSLSGTLDFRKQGYPLGQ